MIVFPNSPIVRFDIFSPEKKFKFQQLLWAYAYLFYFFGHLQKQWILAQAKSPSLPTHGEQGPNSKHLASGLQPTI
jgi:hypothetical protein